MTLDVDNATYLIETKLNGFCGTDESASVFNLCIESGLCGGVDYISAYETDEYFEGFLNINKFSINADELGEKYMIIRCLYNEDDGYSLRSTLVGYDKQYVNYTFLSTALETGYLSDYDYRKLATIVNTLARKEDYMQITNTGITYNTEGVSNESLIRMFSNLLGVCMKKIDELPIVILLPSTVRTSEEKAIYSDLLIQLSNIERVKYIIYNENTMHPYYRKYIDVNLLSVVDL